MKYIICGILISFLFLNCNDWQEQKLLGKWQANQALEDDLPMQIDPSQITLEFFKNGIYNYNGVLDYQEAGTFSMKGNLLYTLDTMNKASTEKCVKILDLTKDSLSLKMNMDGKVQVIKMGRVQ